MTIQLHTHLSALLLSAAVVGCSAEKAPETAPRLQTEDAREQVAAPETGDRDAALAFDAAAFDELRARRPDFVSELLALKPIHGRDRALHFSQPLWAEPEAAVVIFHLLRDDARPVAERRALAARLRTNRAPWGAEGLALLEQTEDAGVRGALMASLADAPADVAAAAALAGMKDASPVVREWATFGASRLVANHADHPRASEVTLAATGLVSDADAQVRAGALRTLSLTKDASHAPRIAEALSDPEAIVRIAAAEGLGTLAPDGARALAQSHRRADEANVAVLRALGRL